MKYMRDSIEFTGAKHLFNGAFLEEGVDYNECTSRLLDGFINHVTIIDAWLGNQYGVDEEMSLCVYKDDIDLLPTPHKIFVPIMRVLGDPSHHNFNGTSILKFDSVEDYATARNTVKPIMHTKLAVYTEEIILGKVNDKDDELKNTYVLFWYSKTRNCSICRFTTDDDVEVIKAELKSYLGGIDFIEKYQIKPSAYSGWLESY